MFKPLRFQLLFAVRNGNCPLQPSYFRVLLIWLRQAILRVPLESKCRMVDLPWSCLEVTCWNFRIKYILSRKCSHTSMHKIISRILFQDQAATASILHQIVWSHHNMLFWSFFWKTTDEKIVVERYFRHNHPLILYCQHRLLAPHVHVLDVQS